MIHYRMDRKKKYVVNILCIDNKSLRVFLFNFEDEESDKDYKSGYEVMK